MQAQPAQHRRVALRALVRVLEVPVAPVLLPEGLHPGVAGAVELAGPGQVVAQRDLEVAAHEVLHQEALAVLERAEPLRVEVVDHPQPLHLGRRGRQPRQVVLGEVADGDGEAVGGGVLGREGLGGAAQGLQAQVGVLQLHRLPAHRHQLGGAPLLVLEAAVGDLGRLDLGPGRDALHRLEGGELLLVHQVDEPGAAAVLVEAPRLGDGEVLWTLLELHAAPGRSRPASPARGWPPRVRRRSSRDRRARP